MGFFDNLADKFDDIQRDAKRKAKKASKKIKKETNSNSVFEAVTKKAGSSVNNFVEKVNESAEECYNDAMRYDPVRICIKMAQTNPLTSPMIYNGYVRALNEKLSNYDEYEIEVFENEVDGAIRGYKYESQAVHSINKILARR